MVFERLCFERFLVSFVLCLLVDLKVARKGRRMGRIALAGVRIATAMIAAQKGLTVPSRAFC